MIDRREPDGPFVQNVTAVNGFAFGVIGADIHVFASGLPLYLLANRRPATGGRRRCPARPAQAGRPDTTAGCCAWQASRLRTLLALVGAADAAGYAAVGSGESTAMLTHEQTHDEWVLLALEREAVACPRRADFPRLAGSSEWDCFLSVKSVDRIEVTREPQRATAAMIALAWLER